MRIAQDIYLVGSGENGLSLTNPYDCNIYLVDCKEGLVMIDAGSGLEPSLIEQEIVKEGFKLSDINTVIITHAHADHVAGAAYFKEVTGAKVLLSRHESDMLKDQARLNSDMEFFIECGFYPKGCKFPGLQADGFLSEGDIIRLGDKEFSILITPGHTSGSVCILGEMNGEKILFTGDMITFNGEINLLCVPDVDLLGYRESINKLHNLHVDTLLPGHRQPIIHRGYIHIKKAHDIFSRLSVPGSIA